MTELTPEAKRAIRRHLAAGLLGLASLNVLGYFTLFRNWVDEQARTAAEKPARERVDELLAKDLTKIEGALSNALQWTTHIDDRRTSAIERETSIRGILERAQALERQLEENTALLEKVRQVTDRVQAVANELATGKEFEAFRDELAADLQGLPIGAVIAWPTNKAFDEDKWRICNGAVLDRERFPTLSNLLGVTYGNAGPDSVKLPDFSGCFLRGAGGKAADIGKYQHDLIKSHEHRLAVRSRRNGSGKGQAVAQGDGDARPEIKLTTSKDLDATSTEFGTETRPVNYAVHWIIRVR